MKRIEAQFWSDMKHYNPNFEFKEKILNGRILRNHHVDDEFEILQNPGSRWRNVRRKKDGLPCFQKIYPLVWKGAGGDATEISTSLALGHPNVVNTVQAVLHSQEGVDYPPWDGFDEGSVNESHPSSTYTKLCELGRIDHFVSGQVIPEAFFWHALESLAMAITYAHDEGVTTFRDYDPFSGETDAHDSVTHNDLSPRNIFLKLPDPGDDYPGLSWLTGTGKFLYAIKHFDLLKFEDLKAIVVMVDQLASDWGPRPLDKYSGAVLSSEWEALMGNCWQRLEEPGTFTASSFLQEIRDARAQVKIENEPLPSRAVRQPSIGVLS